MSNEQVDQLVESLRRVVQTAVDHGLQLTEFDHAVLWWKPYSDSGSTGQTELRTAKDFGIVARSLSRNSSMDQLRSCASEVRKIKWPEFEVDETAETICTCYFSNVGSVTFNEDILRQVAEKYVNEVQSDHFTYDTILQVSHFSAPSAFSLNDSIQFYPVSKADIEHFGFEPLPVRRRPRLNQRDWICKVSETYRTDDYDASQRSREKCDLIIGALGLAVEGQGWFSLLSAGPRSPFLQGVYYGNEHQMRSSPYGPSVQLGPNGIDRYREVFERIEKIVQQESKNLFLAYRRFRAAASREVVDDKLTDLSIGLESLLVPDSGTGEISFKFRMRGAALLPMHFGSSSDRLKVMKDIYNARCDIVHGNAAGDSSNRLRLMHTATEVFRIVFDQLSRESTSVKASISQLDDEMIKAGAQWLARPTQELP